MSDSASIRHLAVRVARREQSRRRTVLLGVGTLIVLSTSPVFGHHLASKAEVLLAGQDHVFNLCLIALHALFSPVHGLFHVLVGAGLLYATANRIQAIMNARTTLHALITIETAALSAPFRAAAQRASVTLRSLRVVNGLPVPAFTAGWVWPRIYVAAELQATLTEDELVTVLLHEQAHALARDPLRLSLLRFLGDTLFYIPALRRLADDIADDAEIAADDYAVNGIVSRAATLASAILKLAAWKPNDRLQLVTASGIGVGFHKVDLLERRVRRLIGEDTPVGTHVTGWSLASAIVTLMLACVSGLIMAHPLNAATLPEASADERASVSVLQARERGASEPALPTREHCKHRQGNALSHIFCLGVTHHVDGSHCPHTGM